MNDKIYRVILFIAAMVMPIVCGGVVYALVTDAYDAFEHFGFLKFLTSSDWSYTEGAEQYGALPFITGTLMTTLLALIFCIPFSLPVALFVGEYFKGTRIAAILSTIVDLLAGIPSIIYGLWFLHTTSVDYGTKYITPRVRNIDSIVSFSNNDYTLCLVVECRIYKNGT